LTDGANLVNLAAVTKAYGQAPLLDGVSLGVAAGDRIGVVGRGGAGKSTLLALLAGATPPDSGIATRTRGLVIGYLPQQVSVSGRVRDAVFGGLAEHEWAGDARERSVISELLAGMDPDSDSERMSGGERRRVALAALLRKRHDLLLLDEPTNHLDIGAIGWLAGHLRERAEALVVVTHDRWFLDAVTEQTWEVAGGQVHAYDGGYSAYVLAKAERARLAGATERRRQAMLRKELAWLRRGPPARTSKPRFRIEAANALIAGEPPPRDTVELTRLATARLGRVVAELEDVSVLAGERVLLDRVTWRLGPGERVGVVGANGSGKTTLLHLLAGRLSPAAPAGTAVRGDPPAPSGGGGEDDASGRPGAGRGLAVSGRVITGRTVRLGYLTQEPAPVPGDLRALQAAEQVRRTVTVGKAELPASQLLTRLGLRGERQQVPVGELSGGERRRLQLLMVLLSEPNVLLLDEPTNDLDIETLTEVEDLLDGWPGSAVVASHDRYFLERVTDHVIALGNGRLDYLPGGVAEYLDRASRGRPSRPWQAAGTGSAAAGHAGASPGARRRSALKELARLERQLARLASQEAELTAQLAANASDYQRLSELGARLREVQEQKAGLEDRWLAVAEDAPQ